MASQQGQGAGGPGGYQQPQQGSMNGQFRPPAPPGTQLGRPPFPPGTNGFPGRPPPPGSQFARPSGPGLAPGQQPPQLARPGSTGPGPFPQQGRPGQPPMPNPQQRVMSPPGQGGVPAYPQQQLPPRNGGLTPAPPGEQGRASPRPGMPPMPQGARPFQPGALQGRPGVPQQQPQQGPGNPQSLHAQMSNMNLGQQGGSAAAPATALSPPPAEGAAAASSKNKRSARAYHQQEEVAPAGQQGGLGPHGYGQPQQADWQAEAAARVAAYESQLEGDADAALDQYPGQRNVLSPEQAAANQQRLASMQAQAQGQRGQLQAPGGAGGAFMQSMPITPGPPGPHTPGAPMQSGFAHQQAGQPGGISQPPHQAGQRFAGPRSKIDPDQIPAPVEAQDADQEFFDKEWFATCGRGGLPLSTTDFGAVDQGNCSPKHMRLTTYSLPFSDELASMSQLPISLVVQPFAQQRPDELPVPVVECGPSGPPRCKRCRAYINPWAIFVEGGQKWCCNLCGTATDVAPDYFCNLDMGGRRVDFEQRPELSRGTVEFRVPKEYWAVQASPPASVLLPVAPALSLTETAKLSPRPDNAPSEAFAGSTMGLGGQGGQAAKAATKAASEALSNTLTIGQGRTTVRAPRPMTYFFAIDVSFSAVRCGSLQKCIESIRETLYGPRGASGTNSEAANEEAPGFGLPHGSRVVILTFDRALHFYNLLPSLEQAQMLVVADIDEPFVPISEGLLADPWDSKSQIEGLLDSLPTMFAENSASEAALGAVVRGVQATLSTIGGQANIFLSTIPTLGPGALKHREDTKLYGTDKERNLFIPQDGWYRGVAEECVEAGIGINVFFFPSQYIDVATIGTLSGVTGGELFFHPRFDPVRDGVKLDAQIKRAVLRETGYNSTMRIRCSNGLHVTDHFGNFLQRNSTDLEFANVDADKSIAALIKHEAKLDEKQEAHFQCAILYTTASGERRVRCSNLAVPVTSLLGNVFRYADLDSTVAYFMKESISLAHTKSLRDVRHYLTERCVKILLAYRRNCASSTSPGQLILPESFKLLPLYALGINKTKAIKGGNVTSDVRTYHMRTLRGMGTNLIMSALYPRMIALHRMSDDDGEPIKIQQTNGDGSETQVEGMRIKCPPLLRPSYQRMEAHGAYLLENGDMCILWLGSQVNPRLLDDLYGVNSLEELDPRMTTLPKLPTKLSKQVRTLVQSFATQRSKPALPVFIARQNRDGMEVELANNLVEDQNNDMMSYVDYLCHVHRVISSEVSGAGNAGKTDGADAGYWRSW
ncbi:hypothetical protein IE81DRAFT_325090 [Ceraceosorus guamensis]|uniref:Beta-sandwich domain of Sec23/24 n=1 Tax=Ceraceosorus guamensis TaxID=1522189 RepID=A0A316VTH6_9BASI|nr:hypothetical protein IE81DRAFT_325090 [Ceraceosorus guamensis]PWN40909.1 hypothetical protein IE81DRAFT_325090 [Ceraceosorus guamensis]